MDVSLDQASKGLALASTALYGFQFYIYNSYYSRICVSPEEVGVTNSFLLPRAAGFIVVFGTVLACFLLSVALYRSFSDGALTVMDVGRGLAALLIGYFLGTFLAAHVAPDRPSWFGPILVAVVIALGFVTATTSRGLSGAALVIALSLSSSALALLIVGGLAARASEVADHALSGQEVAPVTIVSVPVLDVSARLVSVTWIGGAGQQPASIFGSAGMLHPASGLLLGQSTAAVILRLADGCQIVRLPPTQVSVLFTSSGPTRPVLCPASGAPR